MATDPRIRYDILAQTQGTQGVEALARELEKLDAAVDPATAANARDLAAQLRQVGQQEQAVETFRRLKTESQTAARTLEEAQQAAQAYGRSLAGVEAPTKAQIGQQQRLNDVVRRAKTEQLAAVQAVQAQRQALSAAGIDTQKLGVHQAELVRQSQQLSQAAARVGEAYRQQAAAAATSATQQVSSHRRVSEGVRSISQQLQALQTIASAAIGGQLLGGLAGDVTKTADAYSNLSARIRLVTGDGGDFDEAFEGVFDVATRTNSAVEETGTLFTRIAQAGRDIGVTTADALRLTETINQAVQVSGSSAESSNAAIIQLIQGLQSGVLRGEEFNSVMEQAPRLARALADGLGVSTGELRKQAEAGKLTADVVIGALQGQSAVVQEEFSKLPPTVGRAITNLSTEWTRYVGEVDKANGVSAAAANALNALASNLDTVGALLFSLGKAAAAYQALKLAQTFLEKATAARAAAVATAQETAATVANTVATQANTAAKAANATALGNAGGALANSVGLLGRAVAAVKLFSLIGVVTNLKEIGTWLGETAAKWMGYGDAVENAEIAQRGDTDAARTAAQQKAALAQQLQLATDRALGLSAASKVLIADFEGVRQKGGSVSEALDKISKGLELGDLQGIAAAGAALDALALKGSITAQQVREALGAALAGEDLGRFEAQARAAFDGSEQGARRLQAAIDAIGDEALRRAGTSVDELRTGFSVAATSAINDVDALVARLDVLGDRGAQTAAALSSSLGRAVDAAGTERALQAVITRYQDLGRQGLITGDQLTAGLEKARAKLAEITPGVQGLDEALRVFGIKSRAELTSTAQQFKTSWDLIRTSTTVSLQDRVRAFEQYRDAAIAANGGVQSSEIRLQEEMLRMQVSASAAGEVITRSMDGARGSVDRVGDSVGIVRAQLREAQTELDRWNASLTAQSNAEDAARTRNNMRAVDDTGLAGLRSRADNGTLGADDLATAQAVYQAAQSNLQQMQRNLGAYSDAGQRSAQAAFNEARRLLELVQQQTGGGTATAPSTATGSSTHTVKIAINGRMTTVSTTSAADANALTGVLRELEAAAKRAI